MANGYQQEGVGLSFLDRLIDDQPGVQREIPPTAWERVRQLQAALCRDLTALLNTRRAEHDFDASYEAATNSLLSFGIADFTSFNLKSAAEQELVRLSIERAVREFEPRLAGVEVTVEEPDPARPELRFQISALLRTEPAAQPVLFDATLRRESRRISVSGGSS
ncbi:MAG TPA: type VI secretion system baseplate subunit TssE [Verrucomicrobiae bacterium]|nr:type VI secretion system baseplate subunit TssE [Candidatus Acidoferrales bacterium]HXK02367.1 type VI secretion system baseplate subunit TssE [Verrucomicrobiae bacterium]